MVLDSDTENVIVTWSISGVLIYEDSLRKKDQAGDQKTDALNNWYFVSHNIKPQIFILWLCRYPAGCLYISGLPEHEVIQTARALRVKMIWARYKGFYRTCERKIFILSSYLFCSTGEGAFSSERSETSAKPRVTPVTKNVMYIQNSSPWRAVFHSRTWIKFRLQPDCLDNGYLQPHKKSML